MVRDDALLQEQICRLFGQAGHPFTGPFAEARLLQELLDTAAIVFRYWYDDFDGIPYSTTENVFVRTAEEAWFRADRLLASSPNTDRRSSLGPLAISRGICDDIPNAPGNGIHVVYRLWEQDRLLYVGVTSHLRARLVAHRKRFGRRFSFTWAEYETRQAANKAEAFAIRVEDPQENIAGREQ